MNVRVNWPWKHCVKDQNKQETNNKLHYQEWTSLEMKLDQRLWQPIKYFLNKLGPFM